jgi:glycosyltransferase involved in cell wall biosynthesis
MRLASAQAGIGHEVHLSYYAGKVDEDSTSIPGAGQIHRRPMTLPGRWERWTAFRARRTLDTIVADFEVVHLHGIWDPLIWQSAKTARARRRPYVITLHGMLDPWCLQQKSWKKRAALALGWRRVLDRAAFLHVLNADERHLLGPLGLTCPTETIPNGIFVNELKAASTEDFFQSAYGLPGGRVILFLGRLHYKKGLDYLVAAFEILHRSLPDVHLVVAGPNEGAQEKLEQQILQMGLTECVHIIGPLYGEQKHHALRSARCFCLPSRQEGFSIAVLEAMANRIPVIISEACHFPEVAQQGAGRVVPLEPQEIATALRYVLDDSDASRRMGDAGFELVRSRYTWPKIANKCISAYERALAKSAS